MAYTRAVWIEDDNESPYSGAVPSNWINDGYVFWPPTSKVQSAFKKRSNPDIKTWKKFLLMKTKLQTDSLKEAENMADTSAAELDESHEATSKRSLKSTCREDFIGLNEYGSDSETDAEPPSKQAALESEAESC